MTYSSARIQLYLIRFHSLTTLNLFNKTTTPTRKRYNVKLFLSMSGRRMGKEEVHLHSFLISTLTIIIIIIIIII